MYGGISRGLNAALPMLCRRRVLAAVLFVRMGECLGTRAI